MSADDLGRDDRAALAAELALGLLEGPDLVAARALAKSDPAFQAEVDQWTARFAAVLDEVDEISPPATTWTKIASAIGSGSAANDNSADLRRSLTRWRVASGGFGAIAAALALILVGRPEPLPPPAVPAPAPIQASVPMVAMIADDGSSAPVRLVANWDPADRMLVVSPAMKPEMSDDQSMELWVIPADGRPHSMGVMPADGAMSGKIEAPMDKMLAAGATLAISIERVGGSDTGAPQGPVVATGKLVPA